MYYANLNVIKTVCLFNLNSIGLNTIFSYYLELATERKTVFSQVLMLLIEKYRSIFMKKY